MKISYRKIDIPYQILNFINGNVNPPLIIPIVSSFFPYPTTSKWHLSYKRLSCEPNCLYLLMFKPIAFYQPFKNYNS